MLQLLRLFGELMKQQSFQIEVLVFLIDLAVYVLASYYIDKFKIKYLHQSTIAIFLGVVTALIIKYGFGEEIRFSDQYFFALLLPPIVFSVGYGIKKPYFFQNIGTIVFLGVISTIITVSLFTLLLLLINDSFLGTLSSKDILLISIVISSFDPITALPLIRNNHQKLNATVSGESVLNSAVVIILFETVMKIDQNTQEYTLKFIINIVVNFSFEFLFSFLIGLIFGLALTFAFKKIQSFSHQPIKESSLIMLTGYMVYLIGEFMGLSGIIALFTCSIVFSIYGFQNLSDQSKHGTMLAFETVKYISQAFIFAYLGACLLTTQGQASAIGLSLLLILSIPIFRLLSIIVIPLFYKITKTTFPLSVSQKKMLWYAGLMRGVIAFALSLQIQSQNRSFMVTISLIVVMLTTISVATFQTSFANKIGLSQIGIIKFGEVKEQQKQIQLIPATKYSVIGQAQQGNQRQGQKGQSFKTFQQKFIKPFFVKSSNKQISSNIKVVIQT